MHTLQGITYKFCESISGYVWSLSIYTGQSMELTDPFATAKTNKTVATLAKLKKSSWLWSCYVHG
jgi:hypothetical protein